MTGLAVLKNVKTRGAGKSKGIFYSLMVLLLLIPIVLLAVFYSQSWPETSKRLVTKTVGLEVGNFADSVAVDLPRAIAISGVSALFAAVNEVTSTGAALSDARGTIEELGWNGTLEGESHVFMVNNSFASWCQRLAGKAERFGLSASVTVINYSAAPYDSFNLVFSASILVNASSPSYGIVFAREYSASKLVSLEGVEDSLYPLNSRGLVHRVVHQNSSEVFGVTAFDDYAARGYYVSTNDSASFLDRLEGRVDLAQKYASQSPRAIGLESLVNLNDLAAQGIEVEANASVVDNLYFTTPRTAGFPVNASGVSWVRLDAVHAGVYGVELET